MCWMADRVERQRLDRSRGENTCVVDQEIKSSATERNGHAAGPAFYGLFFSDVADREADAAVGGVSQVQHLRGRHRCTEDDVALGGEPERNIAAKTAAGASYSRRPPRMFGWE